jgi:glycosyltransferase
MFSIITATYNAASSLAHCLESVSRQGAQVEHLIIDGGSTDGTLAIINNHLEAVTRDSLLVTGSEKFRVTNHESRITVVSEPDRGIYDAMNKGLRLTGADIIGILNADDFYADDRVLERVAKVFEDPDVEACYGDLVYVEAVTRDSIRAVTRRNQSPDSEGSPVLNQSRITSHELRILRYWRSGVFSPEKFKWGWMPPHPTFFVRRSVYERFGLFNLDLGSAADYELMLRFLLKNRIKVRYIPEVLVCMRAGGVSNASLANRLRANRMDRKAWEVNGLKPYPWTIPMKPVRKIPQYFLRP